MTLDETLALITYANQLDPRVEVTHETARVWADLIGDLQLTAAHEALRTHYRRSPDRVMPANIRNIVNGAPDAGRHTMRAYVCPSCNAVHGSDPCRVLITRREWEERMGYSFNDLVRDHIDELRSLRGAS